MKKAILAIIIALALLIASPFPGYAAKTRVNINARFTSGHSRYQAGWGHHGGWRHPSRGPRFYWYSPWVVGPGPWYPYGYYAAPPVVIQQQPPVYVQPEQQEENYWYYCQNPQGYYPYIRSCQDGWMKVVPDVTPPNP
jgi:hypothetical protein